MANRLKDRFGLENCIGSFYLKVDFRIIVEYIFCLKMCLGKFGNKEKV